MRLAVCPADHRQTDHPGLGVQWTRRRGHTRRAGPFSWSNGMTDKKKPDSAPPAPTGQPPVIEAGPWSWGRLSPGGNGGALICNGAPVAAGTVGSRDLSTLAQRLQELANKVALAGG